MRNRWIAGLVLCSLFVWADAAAWSGTSLRMHPPAAAEPLSVHETHTRAAHHGCCPSLKSNALFQISPSADPCGGQHRCCFSQAPVFPSSLPVNSKHTVAAKTVSVVDCAKVSTPPARNFTCADVSSLSSSLSMVLRDDSFHLSVHSLLIPQCCSKGQSSGSGKFAQF